jgi:hypothetical protein
VHEAHRFTVDGVRPGSAAGRRVQLHEAREGPRYRDQSKRPRKTRKTVPISPIVGIAALATGAVLLVVGRRTRV